MRLHSIIRKITMKLYYDKDWMSVYDRRADALYWEAWVGNTKLRAIDHDYMISPSHQGLKWHEDRIRRKADFDRHVAILRAAEMDKK